MEFKLTIMRLSNVMKIMRLTVYRIQVYFEIQVGRFQNSINSSVYFFLKTLESIYLKTELRNY